jgi:hypothetical protein
MKFYRYWARGEAAVHLARREYTVYACGGSNEGLEAALRRANEIAARAANALEKNSQPGSYGYTDRVLREEIIQELQDVDGTSALITRNAYGALVLNTSRVMFVDVDYPAPNSRGLFRALWNALRGKPTLPPTDRDKQLLERFDQVVASRLDLGMRIYRTAGGYRLLMTSRTFDPVDEDTTELLTEFGSDPLYVKLCKAQECFRARLSAKPWRCGASKPPTKFPWVTPEHEARYRRWEEQYHATANNYATCELVGSLGAPEVSPDVQPILETHDRLTMQSGAALA